MSGLDKILEDIRQEAAANAEEILTKAQDEADRILAAAKAETDEQTARIRKETALAADDAGERAKSSAALAVRQKILAAKQELIKEVLKTALEQARSLPSDQYFALLIQMAAKAAHSGKGVMYLGRKDRNRLPEDFEEKLIKALPAGAQLTLGSDASKEEAISDGFLLSYDGIEENCSFEAVLSSRQEEIQDIVRGILFR